MALWQIITHRPRPDSGRGLILFKSYGWLVLLVVLLTGLKIVLAEVLPLTAIGGSIYDDQLFLQLGHNLAKGIWLGDYDAQLLMKGPGYPLFLAINERLGLPLLASQHLCYSAAILLFLAAVRPLVPSGFQLSLLAGLLLFNPHAFDIQLLRVNRDGFYPALTLWVFASAIGLLTSLRELRGSRWVWAISMGVSMSWFWITREEGPWILPTLAILASPLVVDTVKGQHPQRGRILATVLVAVLLAAVGPFLVGALNQQKFGVFYVSEHQAPPMQAAYGALTRVAHERWRPKILLPKDAREKIYVVSPAFAEMRPYLEGAGGAAWAAVSAYTLSEEERGEVSGGWLIWAIRGGADALGYHQSAPRAMDYYSQIAREVNAACEQRQLDCLPPRVSVVAPWRREYLALLAEQFTESLVGLISYTYVEIRPEPSTGNQQTQRFFAAATHNRLAPLAQDYVSGTALLSGNEAFKVKILQKILKLYQLIVPVLFVTALFCCLVNLVRDVAARKVSLLTLVNIALMTAVVVRLLLLSYLQVSGFSTPRYWAPLYPLVLILCLLPVAQRYSAIRNQWQRRVSMP